MFRHLFHVIAVVFFLSVNAYAFAPDVPLADAAQEARAHQLFRHFRCMTCQSQAIDESSADLAKDLRNVIREKIKTGASDQQIMDFMVSRYGDYILFTPPFNQRTTLLWVTPFMLLVVGAGMIWMIGRRR